jgi:hypothetical protein
VEDKAEAGGGGQGGRGETEVDGGKIEGRQRLDGGETESNGKGK